MVFSSKLTVFAGLNGSGKTTIAVNAALFLGKQEKPRFSGVLLADLDIVNPYFRSKDAEKALLDAGVTFISSEYAGSGLEAPALPKAIEQIFTSSGQIIIDVGGDEAGSTVLGRYSKEILAVTDRQFYLVFNPYRRLTQTAADTKELLHGIEQVSRIPFTGILYNPNLGSITTAKDVRQKLPLANELAQSSNLPLVATCVLRELAPQLQDVENLFCLDPIFNN
ncbi:MAG: hypothetical protein FWD28_10800 [Treponema sp.]|nr:hypothetical protein [Treponema sp.]